MCWIKQFFGCTTVILLISQNNLAQNITISSQAVDIESNEGLPFASVGLKGRSLGTITNLQGSFDFHIPSEFRNEILVISMLGYENYEAPVWTLVNNQLPQLEMKKSSTILKEVVITDSLTGGDILQIAISRIEQNYPMKPYLMDGFYRDLKSVGGNYFSLLEAAIKIYDEDYLGPRNKFKLRERVSLVEVRRSLGYASKFTAYFDEGNLLEDLLLHNNVKYRQFPEENIFYDHLKRGADSYYNNEPVFMVYNDRDYLLRVYVDKRNYGIVHIEYENTNESVMGKRKGLVSKFVKLKRTIEFKNYDGTLYLNYLTVDSYINWYDIRSDELRFESILNQQLVINNIQTDPEERITTKMKSYGLQYQDMPYNEKFWANYNVIKESPLE
ncbi:MAG: carboxypeptidase-like regulatory domain-containing protein [Flammeovirgaceae bacterium]|nr:carboxypeptidase-like regulatory domain-containing protein [Flammeovirgaceae bacterium]